jgi:hypothetical protein
MTARRIPADPRRIIAGTRNAPPTARGRLRGRDEPLTEHESMVEDLLHGRRRAQVTGLIARLASVLEGDGELEIFVPCTACSAPVGLGEASDGRCDDCRRAA